MTSPLQAPHDSRHAAVGIRPHNAGPAAAWSSAGRAYDEISRGIADAIEHCIERLLPRFNEYGPGEYGPGEQGSGEHILDVATGTGWTARRLAARGVRVTALDFAPDLLATAEDLAGARNLAIRFDEGDAENLPYRDGAFDAVISTFGVMFAQRPEAAARELARVCRPGGRLALAVWTPDGNVFEMFKIMKAFMPAPAGGAPTPPSPFDWGQPDHVRDLLGADFVLGFEKATSFYREADGRAAWDTFSRGYGPLRSLADGLDDAARRELKEKFIAFHDAFPTALGICVPRDYWIITGIRR